MIKTTFSKGELVEIHRILTSERLVPCDKIVVCTDNFNSGFRNVYTIVKFVKGKKQLDIGLITRTFPKNNKLEEQLYHYFGGES